ncbi:MAG TPA: zinc-dependent alcohol dehydrogenase [Gemmatimonadaceae bacterium]|nr:zinc-dependent alcohol dehydrogenase [Gemmatimonadaceae bacterium]
MKALVWHGVNDVRVDTVDDPTIVDPTDAIIKITSTAICGSDLHLLDGYQPTMKAGDILGHEPMGVVVEVGSAVKKLKKGDRVVVPFIIACGECFFCKKGLFAACERSNPNGEMAAKVMGHRVSGAFGFSHLLGGFAGGQAEYLRVPFADVGPQKITSDLPDEKVLFLSDIFPTGYMAAENAGIEPGDTVAIWGCGPVAQMAIQSAWMFGAERVIAIDRVAERLALAASAGRAETINFDDEHVKVRLDEMTKGRGPDRCIDAVGTEAHSHGSIDAILDKAKKSIKLGTDRAHVIREAILCCRTSGTVSVPGVYVGMIDKFPFGAAMNKGLTIKTGQTHVQRFTQPLLDKIEAGQIDPSFIITHRAPLADAPELYKTFRDKKDGCIKVVLEA